MVDKWTKEQTIIVLNLYCKIPFNKATSSNPNIIEIANLIGRTPNSVKMKIGNFGSFDPELKKKGIVGLSNTTKLDKEVWDEFNADWDKLAFESELLIAKLKNKPIELLDSIDLNLLPKGMDKYAYVKQRVNQSFFRSAVLSSYNNTCCITGLNIPELLIASHIIPWSKNEDNRTNPHNGLCLNTLHDKAFDKGFITINSDFKIHISEQLKVSSSQFIINNFIKYENQRIVLPDRFIPQRDFLDYHYQNVFLK